MKFAYLNPKIKEETYVDQPSGCEKFSPSGKKIVCRLTKSIYRLKQAAIEWYKKLANFLIEQNFVRSKNDYCLFSKNEKFIKLFVLSWVADLVIAGSSLEAIEVLKKTLETRFKMDDRENLEW